MNSRKKRKQRGVVLMMVLVAVVLVGMALTVTARQSLQSQLSAAEQQRALQMRWGMFSCQKSVLPAASALFDASDRRVKKSRGRTQAYPSILAGNVILGGHTFSLLLADENAKINLNALYDIQGLPECENAIHRLVEPMASRTTQLLPARPSRRIFNEQNQSNGSLLESTLNPAFRSWGEVFDLVQLQRLAGDDRQLATMTHQISLYGTCKLNVLRAKDEVILAACRSTIPDGLSKRLLSRIRETTLNQIDLILEQTITNLKDRAELSQILGTTSDSFSLWIEATGRRARHQRLALQVPDENGGLQITEFSFE